MHKELFSLPLISKLTPHITMRQLDELVIVVIEHPKARAAIALQGAQLLSWQPENSSPVIWLSEKAVFKTYQTIRGGVPICWPWFGSVNQPSHGFIRSHPSTIEEFKDNNDNVVLSFLLKNNQKTKALWPHDFNLFVRFTLGAYCRIELEVKGEFQSTGAFHNYFNVGDINQVIVNGLGSQYIDKLEGSAEFTNLEGNQSYSSAVDRIYTKPEKFSLIKDNALKRVIKIEHSAFSDVVTWNPGIAGTKNLVDMSEEGYIINRWFV